MILAVLIEGISVVVRGDSVLKRYKGGAEAFFAEVPNKSFCADGELAKVSFMVPTDVKRYIDFLETRGLKYHEDNQAYDLVVVDQRTGFRARCTWASFGNTFWNDDQNCPIAVCQTVPTNVDRVVVPDGWVFANSLSAKYRFFENGDVPDSMQFVRRENEKDVFFDKETGGEFYVHRSKG